MTDFLPYGRSLIKFGSDRRHKGANRAFITFSFEIPDTGLYLGLPTKSFLGMGTSRDVIPYLLLRSKLCIFSGQSNAGLVRGRICMQNFSIKRSIKRSIAGYF